MRENAPAPLETSLCAKIPPLCRKRQNRSSVLRKNASLSCGNGNFFLYLCRHKIPAHFYARNAPAPLETSLCAKIPPLCRKRQNRSSVLRKNASLSCGNGNFFLYLCRHKIPAHFYARNAPALPISFLCAKIPRSVILLCSKMFPRRRKYQKRFSIFCENCGSAFGTVDFFH